MRILGLDVGEKRIGVARVDSDTKIALPVGFINNDDTIWREIAKLVTLHNTLFFVLGLPRSNEGNETAQTQYVRNFAKVLMEKIPGARVRFQDESFTSVEAEERLKIRSKIYNKGDIDAEAAVIILQDFIESFKESKQVISNDNNIIKKETDKVRLNTKKVKHKMKKGMKLGIVAMILALLMAGGFGFIYVREKIRAKRADEYARLQAEIQPATFDFTIRPGETIMDIKKHLLEVDRNSNNSTEEKFPNYTESEIDEALNAKYDFGFLAGLPDGATLEGFLYPETHNFYSKSTVKEILEVFLSETEKAITENDLEARFATHGLTLFEGFTLASIVQKEAHAPDQPTVAQVFLTRLQYGMPLGSDVTVSYAIDVVDPDRTIYTDNQTALTIDSCYNTRLHAGLPCGPISNPGLTALLAVADPTDTAYLYFLTGDDGLMYYGYTENEHIQNIHDHCQELCNFSL